MIRQHPRSAPLPYAPFFQSYLSGALPAATTVNVAACPAVTVWLAGCVVPVGPTGAALTVSVAALLVTVPAVFVITPLPVSSPPVPFVARFRSLDAVAPAMLTPF